MLRSCKTVCCSFAVLADVRLQHPSRPPLPPLSPRSLGTMDSTKEVYEAILDLRVATPQIVLNYAAFMLEHKFFEEAFRCGMGGVGWARGGVDGAG